jgi:hypothetical protein
VFRATLVLTTALLAYGLSPSGASVYVVKPDGSGDFPTIQAAIDAAAPGDVITLTDGVFMGDGNRALDYHAKAITVQSQSGDAASCVIDCEGSPTNPRRGFVFHSGEGAGSVLQGITIRNGYCDEYSEGAAIRCTASSPRILDCVMDHCTSRGNGGGIACYSGSAVQIERCTFSGNWSAANGGGGVCYACTPTFTQCVFAQNRAEYEGGGLACLAGGNPVLTRCVFSGNGIYELGGGALFCGVGAPIVSECSFVGNATLVDYGFGGAVCASNSEGAVFSGCIFAGNAASEQGGAVMAYISSLTFEGCTFFDNSAEDGGGAVRTYRSSASLNGCTLYGNRAVTGSGVLCRVDGQVVLDRTIAAFGIGGEAIRCEDATTATLSCSDLYGNEGGDWVGSIGEQYGANGNVSADPLFCDIAGDDYTLHANSPCAPDSNPDCGLIGAWPVGCADTPVEKTTWGAIKAMFRR